VRGRGAGWQEGGRGLGGTTNLALGDLGGLPTAKGGHRLNGTAPAQLQIGAWWDKARGEVGSISRATW
jgi:hypothetical protein